MNQIENYPRVTLTLRHQIKVVGHRVPVCTMESFSRIGRSERATEESFGTAWRFSRRILKVARGRWNSCKSCFKLWRKALITSLHISLMPRKSTSASNPLFGFNQRKTTKVGPMKWSQLWALQSKAIRVFCSTWPNRWSWRQIWCSGNWLSLRTFTASTILPLTASCSSRLRKYGKGCTSLAPRCSSLKKITSLRWFNYLSFRGNLARSRQQHPHLSKRAKQLSIIQHLNRN